MRKITLILGILIAGNVLFAQDTTKKGKKAKAKIETYKEELGLTDTQLADLKGIEETSKEEMEALKSDASLTDEAKKESRKAINEKRQAGIASVLNEDQLAQWEEIKSSLKGSKGKRKKM